jgi:tyrosinase
MDLVDKLEETTMTKVEEYMAKKIAAGKNNGCTLEKAGVRREWYSNPTGPALEPPSL